MESTHIVITWDAYGHTERDYMLVTYSGSTYGIDQYVSEYYGKESEQRWRIATPAEREENEFSSVNIQNFYS